MPVGRPRNDRQLEHCREAGVTCRDCVSNCANDLAGVTSSLTTPQIRQMFSSMYPDPACLSMAGAFVQFVNAEKLRLTRKPVRSEYVFEIAPAYQTAVA